VACGAGRLRIPPWLDVLSLKTWWRYDPADSPWLSIPYHLFNLFEGGIWVVLACLVLVRHLKRRRSRLEWWYALAFFTFGLTDFREAYALSSWLVWVKLANLIALARLRATVIRLYYPTSNLY
jgi:hypothetical protein